MLTVLASDDAEVTLTSELDVALVAAVSAEPATVLALAASTTDKVALVTELDADEETTALEAAALASEVDDVATAEVLLSSTTEEALLVCATATVATADEVTSAFAVTLLRETTPATATAAVMASVFHCFPLLYNL